MKNFQTLKAERKSLYVKCSTIGRTALSTENADTGSIHRRTRMRLTVRSSISQREQAGSLMDGEYEKLGKLVCVIIVRRTYPQPHE